MVDAVVARRRVGSGPGRGVGAGGARPGRVGSGHDGHPLRHGDGTRGAYRPDERPGPAPAPPRRRLATPDGRSCPPCGRPLRCRRFPRARRGTHVATHPVPPDPAARGQRGPTVANPGRTGGPAGPPGTDDRSTPEVVRSLVDNTQLLLKKEIELAKLEVKEIVTARLMAVAFLAVVGVLGLYLLAFLGVTGAKALELVVAPWLAWLIVSGVVLLIMLLLLALAVRKLRSPPNSPERTKDDLQRTTEWAKSQLNKDRTGDGA
ncbi:phage holin family protein [Nitriliruptoraceae bacterium ZYF776]|nr:phage holin family protein [Profundirhabdus halotolerans]